MPITAEGSVVATMAPSSRQIAMAWPLTAESDHPMRPVATNTATTARSRMGAASGIMLRTSAVIAAWKSSGGRNIQR